MFKGKTNINEDHYYNYNDADFASSKDVTDMLDKLYKDKLSHQSFVKEIQSQFSLPDKINIEGSKQGLDKFLLIDNKKFDLDLSLKDFSSIDIKQVATTQDKGPQLYISTTLLPKSKITVNNIPAIYDATGSFLEKYMSLKKAAFFAFSKNEKDPILELISKYQQNPQVNTKVNKLRFINDKNNNTYLRAVVSRNYKLYDNPIILYIAFSVISSLATATNKKFILKTMTVTDSKLFATFFEKDTVKITKDTFMQIGLRIQNSELGDGAARFETIYKITTLKGKKFIVVKDVLSIVDHGYNPNSVSTKLQQLHNFNSEVKDIKAAVKKVEWSKRLTRDNLNYVTSNLAHLTKSLPKSLRDSIIKDLDTIEVTKKTFTLLDLFDKLDQYADKEIPEIRTKLEGQFSYWLRNGLK